MLGHHDQRGLGGAGATLDVAQVGGVEDPLDAEREERLCRFHRGPQRLGRGAGQLIGVGTVGQGHDGDLDVVGLLPGVDTIGRGLTGAVGVVGQHQSTGELLELLDVLLGERGPARGHRTGQAGPVEADDVGVPLADHDLVVVHGVGLRPVESVEDLRLVVKHVVPRVLVLRPLGVGQLPPTEADHAGALVEDREQHARPEEVLEPSRLVREPQTARLEVRGADLQRPSHQVPAVGRPTDPVAGDLFRVEAAAPQVGPGGRRVGTGAQPVVVPVGRTLGQLEQPLLTLAALALVTIGVAQRDARTCGEHLDRADEVELLLLTQEGDRIARGLAAEAVVQPLGGVDREARRLLRMERAQARPPLTDALQLGVLRDDRDDVGGLSNPSDVLVDDAHSEPMLPVPSDSVPRDDEPPKLRESSSADDDNSRNFGVSAAQTMRSRR